MNDNVTIHKYTFYLSDEIVISVNGSLRRLLSVQKQNGLWCAWVESRLDGTRSHLQLNVVGTGNPVPDRIGQYFTTVQDGPFVWHFYGMSS